jgi:hypothetical protein
MRWPPTLTASTELLVYGQTLMLEALASRFLHYAAVMALFGVSLFLLTPTPTANVNGRRA